MRVYVLPSGPLRCAALRWSRAPLLLAPLVLLASLVEHPLLHGLHVLRQLHLHLLLLDAHPCLLLALAEDLVRVAARGEDRVLLALSRALERTPLLCPPLVCALQLGLRGLGARLERKDGLRALLQLLAPRRVDLLVGLAHELRAWAQVGHGLPVPHPRRSELLLRHNLALLPRRVGAQARLPRRLHLPLGGRALLRRAHRRGDAVGPGLRLADGKQLRQAPHRAVSAKS